MDAFKSCAVRSSVGNRIHHWKLFEVVASGPLFEMTEWKHSSESQALFRRYLEGGDSWKATITEIWVGLFFAGWLLMQVVAFQIVYASLSGK